MNMSKFNAVLGVVTVAMLAACSRGPQATAPGPENAAAPAPAQAQPAAPPPPAMDRAKKAAALLALIDASPGCERFRKQLEEAGQLPPDPTRVNDLNQIVASAHDAGCGKKP